MSSAIIHINIDVSNIQQKFWLTKKLNQSRKSIKVENKTIPVFDLPVSLQYCSEKIIKKCITYLKKENITHILLSDSMKELPASTFLKEHFYTFDGTAVINYKIYDILKKYATEKEIHLADSSLLLYTDFPEKAKEIILKLYKHVRKIKIQTERIQAFSELHHYFLEEYGLFIEIAEKINQADITMNIDQKEEKADLSLMREKNQIIFSKGSLFVECKPYHEIDQCLIEFYIYYLYGMISKETMRRFFIDYPVRISKIKICD